MDRLSRYTLMKKSNNKLLLFNTLSTGLLELNQEYTQKLNEMLENKANYKDLEDNLYKGNFINVIDELETIKYMHNIHKFENRSLGLTIAPTLECNFKCHYCYEEGHRYNTMTEQVQDSLVEYVKSQKDKIDYLSIMWYGGEPLLQLDIIESLTKEFVQICEENDIQYSASIVTNGYLLNKEYAERLNKSHVYSAQVTLDGPKEIHDTRRMLLNDQGTYDRIMENLSEVSDLIHFSIRINTDNTNIKYTEAILEELYAKELNKKVHVYVAQVDDINNPQLSNICTPTQIFSKNQIDFYKKALNLGFKVVNLPHARFGICGAVIQNGFAIDPLGDIYKCWNTIGIKEENIGSIMSNGLKISSNYLKWMNYNPFSDECCECKILPLCMGGCPYQKVVKNDHKCIDLKYNIEDVISLYHLQVQKSDIETKENELCPNC